MKLTHLFLGGVAAVAFASLASAQQVINITGSTAYRGATHTAITHVLDSGFTYAYTGGSLGGAGQAIFKGTIGGSTSVTIRTSWTGSVGGVQTVSQSLNVNFLPTTTTTSGGAGTSGVSTGTDAAIPDIAMSDTFQASTPFTSPKLTDTKVGVVPFVWVAAKGAPAGLTNITPQLAQALWKNGTLPLALFTGSSSDEGTLVYATGRDPDSGTRLTAFAESGIGVNATVAQYKPTVTSGTTTAYNLYDTQTVNGIVYDVGQGGEAGGGALATLMTGTTSAGVGYAVTYLSTGDANTAAGGGAVRLSYNGITLPVSGTTYDFTPLYEGKYTFWSYEHLMYRSGTTGTTKTFADTLANQIKNTDATVLLGSMKCARTIDGGVVANNY